MTTNDDLRDIILHDGDFDLAGGGGAPSGAWCAVAPAIYTSGYWTGGSGTWTFNAGTKIISRTDDTASQDQWVGTDDFYGAGWAMECDVRLNAADSGGNVVIGLAVECDTEFSLDTGFLIRGTVGSLTALMIGSGTPGSAVAFDLPVGEWHQIRVTVTPWAWMVWEDGVVIQADLAGGLIARDGNEPADGTGARLGLIGKGVIDLRNVNFWRITVEPWL